MNKNYRLHAFLHPTVIGEGFLVPIFSDERDQTGHMFHQKITGKLVTSLEPIQPGDHAVIIGANDRPEINVGDNAIFAFKSKSLGVIAGDAEHVVGQLKLILDDYANKPHLRSSIEAFIDEHSGPNNVVGSRQTDKRIASNPPTPPSRPKS